MDNGLLIFEDDLGAAALFKEYAESVGFSPVIGAGNFNEAIQQLAGQRNKIKAALLDMSVPYSSAKNDGPNPRAGPDLRNRLIDEFGFSPASILLMSGDISEYDRESCFDHKVDPSLLVEKEDVSRKKIEELFNLVVQ